LSKKDKLVKMGKYFMFLKHHGLSMVRLNKTFYAEINLINKDTMILLEFDN